MPEKAPYVVLHSGQRGACATRKNLHALPCNQTQMRFAGHVADLMLVGNPGTKTHVWCVDYGSVNEEKTTKHRSLSIQLVISVIPSHVPEEESRKDVRLDRILW